MINELAQETQRLSTKLAELEQRVEDMEQYSRVNSVEIHHIPSQKNKEVLGVVKDSGKALYMPISDKILGACHRIGKYMGDNNNPPGIPVKCIRGFD